MNWTRDEYLLTDDKSQLDIAAVCRLLGATYWAADRPESFMRKSIETSVCLGLFKDGKQVGFCRAVTDYSTFTWICDVIVDPALRGSGLGKWMVQRLVEHPELQTRTQLLATKDAHTLYERFGFERFEALRKLNDVY